MRTDSRLSRMLHVLLHMARQERPISSEQIGAMLGTNAAVVRRTMAGLRKAGYVCTEKGRNGGWRIGCDLNRVTLLDVHNAVGGPRIFAIGTDRENPATVEWRSGRVESVSGVADDFSISLADGSTVRARRVILATGVSDALPDVPGLAEQWGRSVFHCPYCHGFELGRTGIGVLASSGLAMHHGLMLPDWGETTLFLNDAFEPDADQLAQLAARGTRIERGAVERLAGREETNTGIELVMRDGRVFPLAGLFVAPRLQLGPLARRIGCELEETPMGEVVETDAMQATSIPGIFACGDVARAAGSITFAVADGAMAGGSVHRSLMFGL